LEIKSYSGNLDKTDAKAIAFFLYEDGLSSLDQLDKAAADQLKRVIANSLFKAKKGKILSVPMGTGKIDTYYLVGLGKSEKADMQTFRYCSGELVRRATGENTDSILVCTPRDADKAYSKAIAEGCLLASYSFDKYKTKKEDDKKEIGEVLIFHGDDVGIETGKVFASAQNFSRDLANEPGNVINPGVLAEKAKILAGEYGLSCSIWDAEKLLKEGMLALWSVGKGSENPPCLIHLCYKPAGKSRAKVVFVGKGITFDSGGLNIKPGDYMRNMKEDKTGACNVLGIIKGVAELKPDVEVHVVIGAAENMPGGRSYRPDDIIKARNGKTIEIDNTDAEGRVTLADSLSFASELKPDIIVDMATLTGACVIALGNYTAGLFTNDDEAGQLVLAASSCSGERMWKLPMDDEKLREQIKTPFADVLNSGGRWGGAITAAMFLEEFVAEGTPWVHLDIAGEDNYKEAFGYYPKGAAAFGVRTCLELTMSYCRS
jgi:leucyl aminopeptidase